VGDERARVLGYSEGQINVEVPSELKAGHFEPVAAPVQVHIHDAVVAEGTLRVRDSSPAIFLADPADENRPAVAVNPGGALNSAEAPVAAGEVLELYLTGHGSALVSPARIYPPQSAVDPVVYFRTFAGETLASQLVGPGLWRIRVRVPELETSGPTPVVVSFDGLASNTASGWVE